MNAPLLVIEDLTICSGKTETLIGVSMEALEGTITCINGPNGAGKTSILLAIAGLLRPQRGSIRFAGSQLAPTPRHPVLGRGIALVAQERQVFGGMSVRENLLVGAHRRARKDAIERDLGNLLARFPRLAERLNQDAATLSGGEERMLAIGRALMSAPKLLLLDEPCSGLAPLIVADVLRLIVDVNRTGVTILLVEQGARPLELADRTYLLERGRVTSADAPGRPYQVGLARLERADGI